MKHRIQWDVARDIVTRPGVIQRTLVEVKVVRFDSHGALRT